jgi:alanyl-tRNA synthetase
LADGVYPSNDGRGYVLRRILRRAVRHAFLLGRKEPTLVALAAMVVETMGSVYPELRQKADHIASVTEAEEERFLETIEGGLKRLDEITSGPRGVVPGGDAFKLYDTYGFPIDLTQVIAAERGWGVDVAGFERALAHQQDRSRRARKASAGHGAYTGSAAPAASAASAGAGRKGGRAGFTRVRPRLRQRFVGYETTKVDTEVLAFRQTEDRLELILRENPFYAESGGQVSDTGVVKGQGWELPVGDVRKVEGQQVVVGSWSGPFEPTPVEAIVTEERRRNIERNHSATHLVHAALRGVLGTHVRQAGSVVDPEHLRFDFSHHHPVGDAELQAIEQQVNHGVWANVDVETYEMSYAGAIAGGAMALFGEKYGDKVRVVDMPGISKELCGGTHVRTTGQIGLFHFTSESGVAAGVRRIEAVTGPGAYAAIRVLDERLSRAAETLRTNPQHLAGRIEALLAERRRLEKQIEELVKSGVRGQGSGITGEEHRINGTLLVVGDAPVPDREQIGVIMDAFREKQRNAVQVLFVRGERPGVHVGVTDDLISRGVRAGDLASGIAAVSGGRGGGRPHFASAGVGDPGKFDEMRRRAPEIVGQVLKAAAS